MKDRLTALWYRLTYCTRHGHYRVHEAQCLNCGTRVSPPGAEANQSDTEEHTGGRPA